MPPLVICIREKETSNVVIATKVSLFSWLAGSACPSTTQPSSCSSGAWPIARKSLWLLGRSSYNWHSICSSTASRKMPRTNSGSLFLFHWPDKGFWHCVLWWSLENHVKGWLPTNIHHPSMFTPWWDACIFLNDGQSSDVCHKWRQTRMCAGPDIVQHIVYQYAIGCILRWWGLH